jgi:uncharacterized membrane protein
MHPVGRLVLLSGHYNRLPVVKDWTAALQRWVDAGVIDEAAASRIRAFEAAADDRSAGLRWPVWLALAFGALMLGAGVLLFVSANWDQLSPAARFALVVLLVGAFHTAGAFVADGMRSMSVALHAVGTVALGAGIYLSGQIFNLDEHWPGGLLLWAFGAAVAWWLLKHSAQMALVALLAPAWLVGEWTVAVTASNRASFGEASIVPASGVVLLALTYFTAGLRTPLDGWRHVMLWLGGLALPPAAIVLAMSSADRQLTSAPLDAWLRTVGWSVALGLPLAVAFLARGRDAWPVAIAALWVAILSELPVRASDAVLYLWWALGAAGLMAWGVREVRPERVNLGAAAFAATVLAFYFSEVMDRLGRSASLAGFGLLFLAGGWLLDRLRRRLIAAAREVRE